MRCFQEVLLVIHKLLRNRAYKTVILSLRVLLGLLQRSTEEEMKIDHVSQLSKQQTVI